MMWNLQSYPTTVLNERMWHFMGQNILLTPPTYFQGSRPPTPRIYASGDGLTVHYTRLMQRFCWNAGLAQPSSNVCAHPNALLVLHCTVWNLTINKLCAWRHNMPPPLSSSVGVQAPRTPPSRRNVAVLSHAEYVPTLITAAALRVKAALSKAAWWHWPFDLLTLKVVSESHGHMWSS